MKNPELILLLLNAIIIGLSYLIIYPRVAGANINKILINDVIATTCALLVAGSMFWGADVQFNIILGDLNWFWFALLSYAALEIPMMLWYFKKHNVAWR